MPSREISRTEKKQLRDCLPSSLTHPFSLSFYAFYALFLIYSTSLPVVYARLTQNIFSSISIEICIVGNYESEDNKKMFYDFRRLETELE
jgi:hypothetical protein